MLRVIIIILLTNILANAQQDVVWASKVLQKSSEFVDARFSPSSRFRAAQILGPPSILPNTESASTSWRPAGVNSGEDYIKVELQRPIRVKQIIIGETVGPGAVGRVFGYTVSGKEILLYQNDGTLNKKKAGILNLFIPETQEEIKALKMLVVHSLNKVPKEYDCLGVSNSSEPWVAKVNVAKELPKDLKKENIGYPLNSKYSELAPLVSADGKTLYFTRLNHPKNYIPKSLVEENGKKGNFTQDVWVARLTKSGDWESPRNMDVAIHNRSKNAVATISMDGRSVYALNVEKEGGSYEPGLSRVMLKGNKWVNKTKVHIEDFEALTYFNLSDGMVKLETEYSMSTDERFLLMGLVRKDTYGDKDLYVSFKVGENQYSKPLNLGKMINTAGNEGSPFLAADNKTLYFNSNGHPGYGDMDIFMTTRLDDTWTNWSPPVNLGPQINSPEFDGYISIPASGEYAYFSSAKNSLGLDDIFKVKLFPEIMPEPVIMLEFAFVDFNTNSSIDPTFRLVSSDSKYIPNITYNEETKTYKTVIPVGENYTLDAVLPGYESFNFEIIAKKIDIYTEFKEIFKLKKLSENNIEQSENTFTSIVPEILNHSKLINKEDIASDNKSKKKSKLIVDKEKTGTSISSEKVAEVKTAEASSNAKEIQSLKEKSIFNTKLFKNRNDKSLTKEEIIEIKENKNVELAPLKDTIKVVAITQPKNSQNVQVKNEERKEVVRATRPTPRVPESRNVTRNSQSSVSKTNELAIENLVPEKVNFIETANNVNEIPLEVGTKLVLKEVFFDQSKADLKDESFTELNRIIRLMNENVNMVILLEGHTDNQGDVDLNFALAKERIENVKNYITKKGNINPERIQIKAWGQYRPLVNNFTEEQRRKNRRVEFTIIKM